jgi:Calcineurin-like phosphoesterase
MEIRKEIPLHPFLFVGCWNNPTTRDYERVFERIRADPITTLILGGDNIYPIKHADGSKTYNLGEVERGYDIIRQGKSLVYTAIGNHNVTSNAVFEKEKELYKLTSTYYCVHFTDGYSLIFLDTMLLINEDDERTEELQKMLEWLAGILSTGIRYYLIIHHPIVGLRGKGPWTLPNKNRLLSILKDNTPISVFCSHLHLFQSGLIEFHNTSESAERGSPDLGLSIKRIPQYIVGTGGAKLDDAPSAGSHSIIEDEGKFRYIIRETQKINGYSRIMEPGHFEFVPLRLSGGYRKTRSRSRRFRRSKRSRKQGKRA